jgi:signal peptide peptidase SppA
MLAGLRAAITSGWPGRGPVVPVVRLAGAIGMQAATRRGLTLDGVAGALERAFAHKGAPAVAILVNSPGGSAVQSHLIFRRIRSLAAERDRRVIAFIEDMGTSGGYMIACAADEILADPASLVGSIGVVSQGFGFVGLMERLGIERRVHGSAENKALLDPFQPERPGDVEHLRSIQSEVHAHFVDLVRERRGARLSEDEELFSGLFWSGGRAEALGLVDGTGELREVLRARFGPEVRLRMIEPARPSLLRRLLFGADPAAVGGHGGRP